MVLGVILLGCHRYSLSAIIGSILVARSAGNKQARKAATLSTSTLTPREIGSAAETPNNMLSMR